MVVAVRFVAATVSVSPLHGYVYELRFVCCVYCLHCLYYCIIYIVCIVDIADIADIAYIAYGV